MLSTLRSVRTSTRAAFTLMEIIIAIVLVGLLIALVGTRFLGLAGRGKAGIVKGQLLKYKAAIEDYKMGTKQFPESLDNLVEEPTGGLKGWVQELSQIDDGPWDYPYEYERLVGPGQRAQKGQHAYELYTVDDDGKEYSVWDY